MDKINFVNDSEPELSAENLNQMQDNIENAIEERAKVEYGEWTPTLYDANNNVNVNVTYTQRKGYYVKMGKLVKLYFDLAGTINSVASDNYATISGLPFNPEAYAKFAGVVTCSLNLLNERTILPTIKGFQTTAGLYSGITGGNILKYQAGLGTFNLRGSIDYIIV